MRRLNELIVSPQFANLQIRAIGLDGDVIYGFDSRNDTKVQYDVRRGVIQSAEDCDYGHFVMDKARQRYNEWIESKGETTFKSRVQHLAALITVQQAQILCAFANHRVNGDEMTKGLKALGIDPPVKIQASYLGGWNVEPFTIEELVIEMSNQRGDQRTGL